MADDWRNTVGNAILWVSAFGLVTTIAEALPPLVRVVLYSFLIFIGAYILMEQRQSYRYR